MNNENAEKENLIFRNRSGNLSNIQSNEKMNYAFLEDELNDMIRNSQGELKFNLLHDKDKNNVIFNSEELDNFMLYDKI